MQSPDQGFSQQSIEPKRLIKHPHHFLSSEKWNHYRQKQDPDVTLLSPALSPVIETSPELQQWQAMIGEKSGHNNNGNSSNSGNNGQSANNSGKSLGISNSNKNLGTSASSPSLDDDFPEELLDVGSMNTMRLMQLSSVLRAVRISPQGGYVQGGEIVTPGASLGEGWWSQGSQQVVGQYYGHDVAALKTHSLPGISPQQEVVQEKEQPAWKKALNAPAVKVVLGLLVGVGMLFLIGHFVDIPTTVQQLKTHLTTTQGVIDAALAAASFIAAFSIRGVRWRLFLSRISNVNVLKAIQIFWVAVFINFLLPVQGGELAKSLLLKRVAHVPINQSLPTVAMDKALDLMPALIIMAAVPFIPSIHMSATLWIILSLVGGILIGLIFVVTFMALNRTMAIRFIQFMLGLLPKGIGGKIEGFALGFVDSLLAGASNPKTFIPAVLLTLAAVTCDGLFAMFAFWTVGVNMSFGTAIFGYTAYNMFCILPSPPGQVGSNELYGVLVFGGLLGFPRTGVLAMFVFSHPLAALIMTMMCVICLGGLGLKLSSALKPQHESGEAKGAEQEQRQMSAVY